MSDNQHRLDHKKLPDKHICYEDDTEDGRCLNRHQARDTNSCSHQWQAFKRAEDDPSPYDWPAYQGMKAGTQVFFQGGSKYVAAPAKGDWDVKEGNFDSHCNRPYFHEAHHIVPNSTLAKAIAGSFDLQKLIYRVRGGLLDAEYNLNYKHNMIMLPLDKAVAAQLKLPRHRLLPAMAHRVYSTFVETELKKHFMTIAAELDEDEHADLESAASKEFLDQMATLLYTNILLAGQEVHITALDEMTAEWFDPDSDSDSDSDSDVDMG